MLLVAKNVIDSINYDKQTFFGEFDLGSGRTLAACLIHASRARETNGSLRGEGSGSSGGRVSNTWATCL